MRRPDLVLWTVLVAALAWGCKGLLGRDDTEGPKPRTLEDAAVESMSVDIRREQKTICPGHSVQMAVFAKVTLKGEDKPRELETPGGSEEDPDKLMSFDEFAFHSEQGEFGDDGTFNPSADLLATVTEPFKIKTVFKKRPDKFSFDTTYPPDYSCMEAIGFAGSSGSSGQSGSFGSRGDYASSKSVEPGEDGGDGQSGGSGGSGGDGGPGPEVEAYVTFVSTAFYDKLVAVIVVSGGERNLALFDPEGSVSVYARGGSGGSGGSGGGGGSGGDGGTGSPGGRGGKGGDGGPGGGGGKGGPGGKLTLVFDERFPELESLVEVDASGGSGGGDGHGGFGGSGGSAGTGYGNSSRGSQGAQGNRGADGRGGSPGSPGSARKKSGDVAGEFADLEGITVLTPKGKGEAKSEKPEKKKKKKKKKAKDE